jgi:2-desacetyl-2-hydroxyethyl bacteriochlorophyllide A dehydrogenase
MKAIYLTGPNTFSLQDKEDPVRKKGDVEIKVLMAGICGSDLQLLRGRVPFAKYPMVPGHEYMGEVVRAPGESKFREGDRVTVFPGIGCGKCPACREGRVVHCADFRIHGSTLPEGCFCERVVVSPQRIFRLPKQMGDEAGAMVEPTAVAVHVNKRAGLRHGMKVVVIGGGVIGLLIAQVARVLGASKVVVSEPLPERRDIARGLGFRLICDPRQEDLLSFVRDRVGLVDAVFDVVSTPQTLQAGQTMLRPDGKLILVGLPHEEGLGVPYWPIFVKELQVIGSRTYFMSDFPVAIRLLSSGKVRVKPLISQILPLEKFAEAVDYLEKEPGKYIKILIRPTL